MYDVCPRGYNVISSVSWCRKIKGQDLSLTCCSVICLIQVNYYIVLCKGSWKQINRIQWKLLPQDTVCVHFPFSPCIALWKHASKLQWWDHKKKRGGEGERNRFSYAKLTKAGGRLLKQTSWTVAAELERLGLPNDSLQVLAEWICTKR